VGRLKAHGLRLGIDGFGSGASSLSNLAQLPLDEMKLGATFVGDMQRSATHAKLVRSLIRLAGDLGLRVVVEGVEGAEAALSLSTLGCERIQGGYVSPPLEAQEILKLEASGASLSKVTLRPQE